MAIRKFSTGLKSSKASGIDTPPLGQDISSGSIYDFVSTYGKSSNTVAPTPGGILTVNNKLLSFYDYTLKNGNQTVSSFTSTDWFTNEKDYRPAFIMVNGNLTINSGINFQPSVRKPFICLYVNGNLTMNGTISMTARGSNHSGLGDSGGYIAPVDIRLANGTFSGVTNPEIPATGGTPGTRTSTGNGVAGNSGSNGGTGGGGSGSHGAGSKDTNGASGTCFSGGSGGGGAYGGGGLPGNPFTGVANGGAGGLGGDSNSTVTSGGGAGNPGGKAWNISNYDNTTGETAGSSTDGEDGTGGVMIIIVEGTLSGSGLFVSNGSSGGRGGPWSPSGQNNWLNGGGGSGGGSINILTRSSSFSGTLTANGGAGGIADGSGNSFAGPGGAGGSGTTRTLVLV